MGSNWFPGMPWYDYLVVGLVFWGVITVVIVFYHKRVKRFIEELLDWDKHENKQQLGRRVSINETVETRFILEDNPSVSGSQPQQGWSEQWSSQVRPPSSLTKNIINQIFEKKSTIADKQSQKEYDEYISNLESGIEVFTESDIELKEMVVVPTTLSLKMHAAQLSRGYYIGNYDAVVSNPINDDLFENNVPMHRTTSSSQSSNSTTPQHSNTPQTMSMSMSSSVGLHSVYKDIDASLSIDFPSYNRTVGSSQQSTRRVSEIVISPSSRFPPVDPLNMTFIGTSYSQNAETTHSAVSSALTSARSSRAVSLIGEEEDESSQASSTTVSTVQQLRADELHERLSALAKQEQVKANSRHLLISTINSTAEEFTSPTKRRFTSSFPPHRDTVSSLDRVASPLPPTRSNVQHSNCDLKYTPLPMSPPCSVKSDQIKQSLAPILTNSQIKQALSPVHSPTFVHFAYKSVVHDETSKSRLHTEDANRSQVVISCSDQTAVHREGQSEFGGRWYQERGGEGKQFSM